MIEELKMRKAHSALSQEPDEVDENKNGIEDNTINGEPNEFEDGIDVSFKEGGDADKRANDASPLHRVYFEGDFLGDVEVLDLLHDRGRNLIEVGGDQ